MLELRLAAFGAVPFSHGALYIGVTSNLVQRGWQHKEGVIDGFTHKYTAKTLV